MQLVLDTKGLQLLKKRNTFELVSENGKRIIAPGKLESIAITANVTISADAVKLAIKHEIPILFFDNIGKAKARLWSPYFESIATLRRNQIKFAESTEGTEWILELFALKTQEQASNLKYLKRRIPKFKDQIDEAIEEIRKFALSFEPLRGTILEESRNQIMGVEGSIARVYWQNVGAGLPFPYGFQKRTRRPAKDLFNACINYLYGMMYSIVEGGLFAAGLDPQLGLLHADEYRKATLTFDLIEPVRPWVDRLLIDLCLDGKIEQTHLTKNQHGLFLNKKGKAVIIPAFNAFLREKRRYLGQEASTKNQIYRLATLLARRIRAEYV